MTQSPEQHENRLDRLEQLAETTLLAIGQLAQRQNEFAQQQDELWQQQQIQNAVTDAHIQAMTTGIAELAVSVRELRNNQEQQFRELRAGQEQQARVLDYLLRKEQERQNGGQS